MVSFIDTLELSAYSATWLELLVAAALKGMVILIIAAVLSFTLRRASAASRHLVWSLALASLLAMPILSFGLPSWQVSVLPGSLAEAQPETETNLPRPAMPALVTSASLPQNAEPSAAAKETRTEATSSHLAPAPVPVSERNAVEPLGWSSWALMIWMASALAILVRLMIGTAIVWWMARRAKRITDGEWVGLVESLASQVGISRPVRLLKSSRINMPVTCGLVRSRILLPADAGDWSDERRQVVLLHELAHVKRRDCLTQMLAQLACAVYWFNPLIWGAARQLRIERERACDDQVLDAGTKASDYADHLLDLARSFRSARCSSLAAVAIARRSQLEGRLLAILDPSLSRGGLNRIASMSVALIVALIVLPLAAIRPSAQAQSKASPRANATRSIIFDSTARTVAPESGPVSSVTRQATGENRDHQFEQSAQPPQAETAQAARLSQNEQEADQKVEQAPRAEQRDNSSTVKALTEALKDEDAEVRQHALFALTQIGGPQTTEAFASALKDSDPKVRERAVWGIGLSPGNGMVDLLIGALNDSNPEIRQRAAWSLGLKGDHRSVQPLINALKDESDEVRERAAWALALKGDKQAVEPLIDALKDKDVEVRAMAAWALGLRGDSRAAKALSAMLKDENKYVRGKAEWALGLLMMKSGEAMGEDNNLDIDIDTAADPDSGRGGSGSKAKARSKQK